MTVDLSHLRQWLGRTETQSELLTESHVQRFNATFDRTSDLILGATAPLLIHLCLCQPAVPTAELGPDGHPERGGFLPPVPLPRRMWAGGAFTFHAPIRIGDTVTRQSEILDVVVKEGRSGILCFVTVEHRISSGDTLAVTERQDIVYRDISSAAVPEGETAPKGHVSRRIIASSPLLFRYSALTFNGHRIHYDNPHTTKTEGYPGLIIHGPMQATLLAQLAADVRGSAPTSFRFRSLSPIFDTDDFHINAEEDGEDLLLWTNRTGGPVAMQATASW